MSYFYDQIYLISFSAWYWRM